MYLHADPLSYIGGAIGAPEVTWTQGINGDFDLFLAFYDTIGVSFSGGDGWLLFFEAPRHNPVTNTDSGTQIGPGFYDGATRWPFNLTTEPGFDVTGGSRGLNGESGYFNVLDVAYNPDNSVLRLAIDFRQFEDQMETGPSLYGSVRINSNIPLNLIPIPAAAFLFPSALALLGWVRRRTAV